jgi:response regulator RpfG family c-di-GMP phosphodiesterase
MKKVIIAEDLISLVEKDRSFFNRTDIRLISAATNEEILALHRDEKADLIITNLDMLDMNAENLCALIRNDVELRGVSIIIVCPETIANLQRCIQCGANAFVTTPVNHAVLLQEAYLLLHVTPRRSCRIDLKLKMEGKSKESPLTGLTENISSSGMLFRSAAIFFEGDSIRCSFSLPGSTRISATADIVRVLTNESKRFAKHLYGVIFSDISDDDISAINAFVEKH